MQLCLSCTNPSIYAYRRGKMHATPHLSVSSRVLVWGKFRTLELTDIPTNLANQVKVCHALGQSRSVQSRGPERAHKAISRHGDRRVQIADFRDSFKRINWLYLVFKCRIKTKHYFEWLLWHWSSLSQLNLEPTRPSVLMGCKVPTDLVKISVEEATHMGFYLYITSALCVLPMAYYALPTA